MIQVGDVDAVRRDQGDVTVVEIDDPSGMRDDGRGVRGDQALPFADADDQRTAFPGDDDATRFIRGNDRDAVSAFDLTQGADDCLPEVALVILTDQAGDRFGVGFGAEDMALGFELGP